MNTHTEHDRQLAEKLKSLSLQDVAFEPGPKRRSKARLFAGAGALAICAVAAITLFVPDALEMVPNSIGQQVTSNAAVPALTSMPVKGRGAEPVVKTPTAQRSIAGSGHVKAPVFAAVFPRQTARIASVDVEVGDYVSAGQVIVRLEDTEAVFKLKDAAIAKATAQLALDKAKIELADATAAAERLKALVSKGIATRLEGDKAALAKEQAQNNIAVAQQALGKSELDHERATSAVRDLDVIAPISGTITAREAQVGEMVLSLADGGKDAAALFTITDTASLVIDVDIAESSLALVQTGLTGEAVLDGFPDQPFAVEVSRIAPVVSAERGTVGLRLTLFSPPQGIRPNMAARVNISGTTNVAIADQNKGIRP